jgi:GT2 family glycosyltransferase
MPLYNAAAYVADAVNSVLQQQFSRLELVIVNDGSTDDSHNIAAAIPDPRVRLLHQHNQGQSAAINRGVRESFGQFIKIVDADDWINPEHLAAQLQSLRGTADCVSACRWGYFQNDSRHPAVRSEHANSDYSDPLEWIVDSLTLDEGMMGGWKWLIPRTVWERSGGYDPRLSLNNDFHASIAILLSSHGVRFASDAVYSYRRTTAGSLSRSKSLKALESAFLTTELGCNLLLARESSTRIRRLCADRYQRWAFDLYPTCPDLATQAEARAHQLGGSLLPFPGGVIGRTLAKALGWRSVRQLQRIAGNVGWTHVERLKRKLRSKQQ